MAPTPGPALYLVDGTSQLFRAFYAIRGLANAKGMPTNAVYGFTSMLRKLLREEGPKYLAVAFDLAGPTFRHGRYAEYKAQRPPIPADLDVQMPWTKEVCRAFRVPILEQEGYEADDLIATYARIAREAGWEVVVVAADKDLLQLVGEGVSVLNPVKNARLDASAVAESFGVPPHRVVDVLGLMGDSVDNIPGVPGVGEKTALAMVASYGDFETILERARRFADFYDARDGLIEALDALGVEEALGDEAARRVCTAAERAAALLPGLRAVEADAAFRERLAELQAAFEASGVSALLGRVGTSCKGLAKDLKPFRKALADLDRASARRIWTSVRDHEARARMSRELAILDAYVPVAATLDDLALGEPDREEARLLFEELGFRTLTQEFSGGEAADRTPVPGAPPAPAVEVAADRDALERIVAEVASSGSVALRARGDALDPVRARLTALDLSAGPGRAWRVPLGDAGALDLARAVFGPALADPAVAKAGHGLKDDLHLLSRHRLGVQGPLFDIQLAAWLLEPDRPAPRLEQLAQEVLGRVPAGAPSPGSEGLLDSDSAAPAEEAEAVARAVPVLRGRLAEAGLSDVYDRLDGPLLPVLVEMEEAGIRIDVSVLREMSGRMQEALDRERAEIHRLAGREFNVDSPKQLREVLFEELGLRATRKTAKGGLDSTDAATLEDLAGEHEIARRLLAYRETSKLKGTYVDTLPGLVNPATGRVHTRFHPTGAATGRLSSSDPNLQNIPARSDAGLKIREAFVPEPGWVFLASDYSQVELRVLAHLCQDPGLIAAFRAGEDIHRVTAAKVNGIDPALVSDGLRRRAKAVNFGILYGMSETRLARDQGMTRSEARAFIKAYFERFAHVRAYIDRIREEAIRDGAVSTLFGRVRRFPQLKERTAHAVREASLRAAVNATIQGTAADLMKLAMLRSRAALAGAGLRSRILLQVHDELLLEVPEEELERVRPLLREAMEGVADLAVPLAVDQKDGSSWAAVT